MTNNGTDAAHPRFQLSLRELVALVLVTCCVTGLANIGSPVNEEEKLPHLLSATIFTAALCLLVLWLVKTRQHGYLVAGIVVIPIVLAIALPSFVRTRICGGCTAAAASCKAYAEAQEIYHRTDWDGDGVLEYAQDMQQLIDHKSPGDGVVAMIDRAFADADARLPNPEPKAGYFYRRLLYRMVDGKPRSYIVNGDMLEGYAFVAFPAEYDVTGRDTFIISNTGTIYQKDLGPNTDLIARTMTTFDVSNGTGWVPTE